MTFETGFDVYKPESDKNDLWWWRMYIDMPEGLVSHEYYF